MAWFDHTTAVWLRLIPLRSSSWWSRYCKREVREEVLARSFVQVLNFILVLVMNYFYLKLFH